MRQAMQQRELLKECKKREEELRERLQVEIIYNNEKQKALLEAKVAPAKKETRLQKSASASDNIEVLIQQQQKVLDKMKTLPTPIRDYVQEVYERFKPSQTLDEKNARTYEELVQTKKQRRLYKVKSEFEKRFAKELLPITTQKALSLNVDDRVFEELEKNVLMYEEALKDK